MIAETRVSLELRSSGAVLGLFSKLLLASLPPFLVLLLLPFETYEVALCAKGE